MPKSVLRPVGALAIAAGCCIAAPRADAEQWLFQRIAQTGDSLPYNNSMIITDLYGAGIEDGNVVYGGTVIKNAVTMDFIACRINGINRTVATGETPVPDGIGNFGELRTGQIDGDTIIFGGEDQGRGNDLTGVYRYHPAAKLHKIITFSSPVPGMPGSTFDFFSGFFSDDGVVGVDLDIDQGGSSEGAFYTNDNGVGAVPLTESTPLPDGQTINFFEGSDYRAGTIASRLRKNSGPRGLYLFNDTDGDQLIMSEGDLVPDGAIGETFTLIGSAPRLDRDGKQVAILASGNMGSQGIFIKPDGSFLQMLVGAGDAAPPTFANDFDQIFGDMALDNGAMAFVATTTADANVRLYSNLGGQTKLVLQPGDMLDGKTVMGVQGVSNQGISGSTIIFSVSFDDSSEAIYTATLLQETVETEPNNAIEDANCIEILSDCVFINGKLQHNEYKACDPDTVLCAFDKQGAFLVDGSGFPRINDDDAGAGDGRGSALWDIPLVYNNGSSGPSTLRLGVTGAGDIVEGMGGNNGVFNGLIQNAPHEQLGQFTLTVTFVDDQGVALPSPAMLPDGSEIMNPFETVEEFQSGSEAFFFNFVSPVGADAAHAVVDNTTGRIDVCNDVDLFIFKNLIPGCPYCVIQVGGLDEDCNQTDGLLAWFDKDGDIILTDDNSGVGVFASLCDPDLPVIADVNGVIRIAFSGSGDNNFNGLRDGAAEVQYLADHPEYLNDYPGLPPAMALAAPNGHNINRDVVLVCADEPPAHGVCGCYTLKIMLDVSAHNDPPLDVIIQNAMYHGDINMDGVTDTSDLGILLGFFGWVAP